MSDFTYVENVAHALICAEEALRSSMASAAGKAFFITNLEPVKFWDFVSLMLEGLGYQRPVIKVPASMVSYGVLLAEWMQEKLGSRKHSNPLSAHCIVRLASCTRTFNCSAAQKHINYSPIITMEEGVTMTIEAFSHLAKDPFVRSSDFNEQSKVDKLLGSGKVADILLWRDEKETFTYFLVVVLLFYWFFLCGRTFVSSAAKLLLLVTLILYGHGHLPSNIFGLTVPRIPSSSFEISEATVKDSSTTILYLWNRVVQIIRALGKGDDWNVFFKVAVSLCFVKMILSRSLNVVIGTALVLPFMSFFIYEQYENEINASVGVLFKIVKNLKGLLMRNLPASAVKFISSYEISNQNEGPARVNNRQ